MKSMASERTQKTHVSAVHQITAALMVQKRHCVLVMFCHITNANTRQSMLYKVV